MALSVDYQRLLLGWMKGNQSAYDCLEMIFDIAHTCDDLTDQDKPVSTAQVQAAFGKAMIDLPRNPFYVTNFALLNGALQVAFLNWQIANQMELTNDEQAKTVAFVLRSSYTDLVTLAACIIGGSDWAVQVGYESRLHASGEGMAAYLASLTKEARRPQLVEG
jgi:hypothetical protein